MSGTFRGFVSYSHQQSEWVGVLHANLERCGWSFFLDELDLAPGRSWVQQVQAGVDAGGRLVLVATPDALASPRVMDEWGGFVAARPEWKQLGLLQVVRLLWAPMPLFLEDIQAVDFRRHDEQGYRRRLGELIAGLEQAPPRRVRPLPADIIAPPAPRPSIEDQLRSDLVDLLGPCLAMESDRREVAGHLGIDALRLSGFPSLACAASAALLLAGERQDPHGTVLKIHEAVRSRAVSAEETRKLRRIEAAIGRPGAWQRVRAL
jgi:hypothetical protein